MRHLIAGATVVGIVAVVACSDVTQPPPSPSLAPTAVAFGKAPKVTICHAAGLAGTTHYISITISQNGLKGHFLNNGTPKAGHELDFIVDATHPCNAPVGAVLQVCKLSSGQSADPNATFAFTTNTGESFSLHFGECSDELGVDPGNVVITEAADPNGSGPGTYFATSVTATGGGSVVSSSGFTPSRVNPAVNAVAEVGTTAGNTTVCTFYNQN